MSSITGVPASQATDAEVAAGYQPLDADLTAIAALTSAADKVAYATGAGAWALTDFKAFGRTLAGAATVAAAKTSLVLPFVMTTHWAGANMVAGTKLAIWGSTNTATVGLHVTKAVHITRMSVTGNCGANTGNPAFTVTLWNTNQTAGSEILTTSNATAITTGFEAETTTIVNSGKDAIAAGTRMILTAVLVGGTSATIGNVGILIEGTFD